jgi:hypothetical protein
MCSTATRSHSNLAEAEVVATAVRQEADELKEAVVVVGAKAVTVVEVGPREVADSDFSRQCAAAASGTLSLNLQLDVGCLFVDARIRRASTRTVSSITLTTLCGTSHYFLYRFPQNLITHIPGLVECGSDAVIVNVFGILYVISSEL